MRPIYSHSASLCLIVTLLLSCKDDLFETPGPPQPEPVTPDLSVMVTSSVSGFVADESGQAVAGADVTAGNKHTVTDEFGYFEIANTSQIKIAGSVQVTKSGYFKGFRTFTPQEERSAFVRVQLLARTESGTISATSGGTISTPEGATVTLPAGAVVLDDDKSAYSGSVHVYARALFPADDSELSLERPGDSRGTNSSGHLTALRSYSTVAVELTGDAGEPLQIAEGKQATIELPIPAALVATAPSDIDLWSFNTDSGLWSQEGKATKTGNRYAGSVSHFSFWDGAEGFPLVNFSTRIVNEAAQPLTNVPVTINFAGMPKNAGHGRFGYTDANGYVSGAVFANAELVLDVITPCATSAYSHNFSTTASDIDLGTITGNLGQQVVTLTGTVSDCVHQPVTDGYVQVYDHGFYHRIAIVEGAFTFTGIACTNMEVNVVVVNHASGYQNEPEVLNISGGMNNLGAFVACGESTMGHITYTLDGTTTVEILEPADTLAGYKLPEVNGNTWTQILTLSGNPNESQKMSFQFDGGSTIGSAHKLTDVFSVAFPSGRGFWPAPVTVTITEYGEVGGFISGSFSSNMLDFETNALHTLNCTFRVRRLD